MHEKYTGFQEPVPNDLNCYKPSARCEMIKSLANYIQKAYIKRISMLYQQSWRTFEILSKCEENMHMVTYKSDRLGNYIIIKDKTER